MDARSQVIVAAYSLAISDDICLSKKGCSSIIPDEVTRRIIRKVSDMEIDILLVEINNIIEDMKKYDISGSGRRYLDAVRESSVERYNMCYRDLMHMHINRLHSSGGVFEKNILWALSRVAKITSR